MTYVSSLVSLPTNVLLTTAGAINEHGQIVVNASIVPRAGNLRHAPRRAGAGGFHSEKPQDTKNEYLKAVLGDSTATTSRGGAVEGDVAGLIHNKENTLSLPTTAHLGGNGCDPSATRCGLAGAAGVLRLNSTLA